MVVTVSLSWHTVETVSRPGGRGPDRARTGPGRGRSGLRRAGCWLTASRGDPQDSATENRPPMAGMARTGKGETVRQERTSGSGDRTGSVNPTRSKAKRGTWAARPPRQGQSPGRPRRWMATQASREAGQNPAYRPAHRVPCRQALRQYGRLRYARCRSCTPSERFAHGDPAPPAATRRPIRRPPGAIRRPPGAIRRVKSLPLIVTIIAILISLRALWGRS